MFNNINIFYNPLLESNQVIKLDKHVACGYMAYGNLVRTYFGWDKYLDEMENIAKINLKRFVGGK